MKIKKIHIDSIILKEAIFEIFDYKNDFETFAGYELDFIKNNHPDYIQISIDSNDIYIIHFFEKIGFRFIQFKFLRRINLDNDLISYSYLYPYQSKLIDEKKDIKKVLTICQKHKFDDRFTIDDHYTQEISLKRIEAFISKSFNKKDEFVLAYINTIDNEIIGFQTGQFININHILLYINSIIPKFDNNKYREIFDLLLLNWLKERKIKIIDAYSDGSNLSELNITIKNQGFEIIKASVILRKLYEYN